MGQHSDHLVDASNMQQEDSSAASEAAVATETPNIDFVTLGMFIIDEIEYPPPRPPVRDIIGGAGSYSALGARLFSPPPISSTVGWIVDQGADFPEPMTALIDGWQTSAVLRPDPGRPTTRGWNGYEAGRNRAFRYLTPKKRLTAADLAGTPLLAARAFHLICGPARCRDLVADLRTARRARHPDLPRPLVVWEPVPDLCTPDELLSCTNTLPLVDVCSPNHAELAGFMGDDASSADAAAVERACEQLLASMPLQSYSLVVRCGALGCYVARNGGRKRVPPAAGHPTTAAAAKRRRRDLPHGGLQPDTDMEALFAGLLQDAEGVVAREEIEVDPGLERWIPAFHPDGGAAAPGRAPQANGKQADGEQAGPVVDPTGGGNAFLGGLAVALARGRSVEDAAVYGTVAASFAIEQVGVPVLGVDGDGNERWNGVRVEERLQEFRDRLA